jgi:hypothetical protein
MSVRLSGVTVVFFWFDPSPLCVSIIPLPMSICISKVVLGSIDELIRVCSLHLSVIFGSVHDEDMLV